MNESPSSPKSIFSADFSAQLAAASKKPKVTIEEALLDYLSNPHKYEDLSLKIKLEPHRRQELIAEAFGLTAKNSREKELERRLKQPYYKVEIARKLLPLINAVMTSQKDQEILVKDCGGKSEATMYAMVTQALVYIQDHMDLDGKITQYFNNVKIARSQAKKDGDGWVRFVHILQEIDEFKFSEVKSEADFIEVYEKIQVYMETGKGLTSFKLPIDGNGEVLTKPFNLTQEQIKQIETFIDNFDGAQHVISTQSVLIAKTK